MHDIQTFIRNILLPSIQLITMIIGIYYISRLKKSYWKWFSFYLILICGQEFFWLLNPKIDRFYRETYYIYLGIPIQYIFLYWLYAFKSLNKRILFITLTALFTCSLTIAAYFMNIHEVYSVTTNVGTLLLIILFILESVKQIKTDEILKFKENKMFYINLGLILFYLGTYPYQIFIRELYENHFAIWNVYYVYFLLSNCIMYLLFAASFLWGKTR